MLVSVIVPVYNMEKYLDDFIENIKMQSLRNIEIIFIDDCSNDNSLTLCKSYEKIYNNIKVFSVNKCYAGGARNFGISKAKGKYISFIDADDIISPVMLENMINLANEENADVVICGYEQIFERTLNTISNEDILNKYSINNVEAIKEVLLNKITTSPCDKIYRKDMLIRNNIFFEKNRYYEDILMVLKTLYFSKKTILVDNKYYKYYKRHDSVTNTYSVKHYEDLKEQVERTIKFVRENVTGVSIEIENFKCIYNLLALDIIRKVNRELIFSKEFIKLNKDFIIFGASNGGEILHHYFKIYNKNILAFCDNNKSLWGRSFKNIDIIEPNKLKKFSNGDYNILIASMYYDSIYKQLKEMNLSDKIINIDVFKEI